MTFGHSWHSALSARVPEHPKLKKW